MPSRTFYRSRKHKLIFGVAGGIAEYFDLHPGLVRGVFAFLGLMTVGAVVPIYLLLALMTPYGDGETARQDQEDRGVTRGLIAIGAVFCLMILAGLCILIVSRWF